MVLKHGHIQQKYQTIHSLFNPIMDYKMNNEMGLH